MDISAVLQIIVGICLLSKCMSQKPMWLSVGNMREVRNNVNTSSKTKKTTLTYKEAVLKQNKIVEKIANVSEEKPILNKREPHAMFIN